LYLNSTKITNGECDGPRIQQRGATVSEYVGAINVFLCRDFTIDDEGIYTCTMRNSSNVKESAKVGVYFPTRSKFRLNFFNCCMYYLVLHLVTDSVK